jgi:hypothetical protein
MPLCANSPLLARTLRRLFGGLRLLMVFGLLTSPFNFLNAPKLGENKPWFDVADIIVKADSLPVQITRDSKNSGIVIGKLTAQLALVDADAAGRDFLSLVRWTKFFSGFVIAVGALVIFDLLWRLCRNVERGEIFTEQNLRFVRRLGTALVIFSAVWSAVETWNRFQLRTFVQQHFTFSGLQPFYANTLKGGFFARIEDFVHTATLDVSTLLVGLLVIVLAEAFRRGLALQKEAELTV